MNIKRTDKKMFSTWLVRKFQELKQSARPHIKPANPQNNKGTKR